jgi:hypothetical protein
MQKTLLRLLLGKQASSSTVGYLLLAFDVFHQLQNGFDFKLAFAGVAVFFVLRFMNEHGINVAPLLDEVLKLSAEQQATKIASGYGGGMLASAQAVGLPLPDADQRMRTAEGLRELQRVNAEKITEGLTAYDAEKDALRNHPDPLRVDL